MGNYTPQKRGYNFNTIKNISGLLLYLWDFCLIPTKTIAIVFSGVKFGLKKPGL